MVNEESALQKNPFRVSVRPAKPELVTSRLSRKKLVRVFSQIASERVTSVREKCKNPANGERTVVRPRCSSLLVLSSNALCVRMQIPVWSATSEPRTFICHAVARTCIHTRGTRWITVDGVYEKRVYLRTIHTCFSTISLSVSALSIPLHGLGRLRRRLLGASHSSLLSSLRSHPPASRTNFQRPRRPSCTLPRLSATVISRAP